MLTCQRARQSSCKPHGHTLLSVSPHTMMSGCYTSRRILQATTKCSEHNTAVFHPIYDHTVRFVTRNLQPMLEILIAYFSIHTLAHTIWGKCNKALRQCHERPPQFPTACSHLLHQRCVEVCVPDGHRTVQDILGPRPMRRNKTASSASAGHHEVSLHLGSGGCSAKPVKHCV